MTWHHVFLITISFTSVVLCAHNGQCSQALPSMIQLATMVISGVLGHAGASMLKGKLSLDGKNPQQRHFELQKGNDSGENPVVR